MKYQIECPSDEDLFESSGHSNAAKAIEKVILEQSCIHSIGLEGELGSGKSTVLKLLEKRLPNDKYKFITFDVEQYHHSSTKAAFVKHLRDCFIEIFGNDNSKKSEEIKKCVINAADRALGNELTYTKKVKSNLSWYTVSFAISLMLSIKYAKDSLENIFFTAGTLLPGNSHYSFGLSETISTLLGLSPFAVALVMLIQKRREKNIPNHQKMVPNIGDIFKRNSEDKITEKLEVTREVGASELKKAFQKIVSVVPNEQCVILIIDNLDRVDREKVREVWSDLEIFTSFGGNNLRVIVPFSEKHVSIALSESDQNDGIEFILKRLPVKFRTPPVVSAGWRKPFEHYWNETLIGIDGIELCAELIDVWISPKKQITPRFLKTHINEIAVALNSTPEEISTASCSAYLLSQRAIGFSYKDLISNNHIKDDSEKHQVVLLTHKVLRRVLSDEDWSSEIMAIHYQTSIEIAKSELLETPLNNAVYRKNFEDIVELSKLFGFDVSFQRLLSNIDPYIIVKLAANYNEGQNEHITWLKKWIKQINLYLEQEKNNPYGYDQEVLEAYKILKSAGYNLSNSRLISEHKFLSEKIKDSSKNKQDIKLLSSLYHIEEIIGYSYTPEFISSPNADYFVNVLWDTREDFPQWHIEDKPEKIKLENLISEINRLEFELTNSLILRISKYLKLGQINIVNRNMSQKRNFMDYEYEDCDFPQVLLASDFTESSISTELIKSLEKHQESNYLEEWVALAFTSCLASTSLKSTHNNSTFLDYLLSNYYSEECTLPLIKDFMTFTGSYENLLKSADESNLPTEIKELIYSYIGMNKVHALNIKTVSNLYYSKIKCSLKKEMLINTLDNLFGWKRFVETENNEIFEWQKEFLRDTLEHSQRWREFIIDWFDSGEHNEEFWQYAISQGTYQFETIIAWYASENRKIKNTSKLTHVLLETLDNLISDKNSASIVNQVVKILPKRTSGKIEREASKRLISEQTTLENKLNLIENFRDHIHLPNFKSNASIEIVIHLIENLKSQIMVDWLCEQKSILDSIKWGEYRLDLSQALNNIEEHFEIRNLSDFIIEEADLATDKLEIDDEDVA
ncbi:P-loop NTPase fold protein [Shewanella algae]|uniref:P-loop NTPase fold protein n=1 Tax=Shewanella algae TaxID=38313 RepID=UPI0031F52A84